MRTQTKSASDQIVTLQERPPAVLDVQIKQLVRLDKPNKEIQHSTKLLRDYHQSNIKYLFCREKVGLAKAPLPLSSPGFWPAKIITSIKVGILDIDICGPSIPRMMGVENAEVRQSSFGWEPVYADDNLAVMSIGFMLGSKDDAVIWRGPRKNGLIKQFLTDVAWGNLDFLIVDAPPGTSDEHISIAQYLKEQNIDGAIVVTTPQEIALLDVRKEINFCRKTGIPVLGVVENMAGYVCPCCKARTEIFSADTGGAAKMAADMGIKFFGSIPLDPLLLRSCERGESYFASHPDAPATKPFSSVVEGIMQSLPANTVH